jgi:hypothetical protein
MACDMVRLNLDNILNSARARLARRSPLETCLEGSIETLADRDPEEARKLLDPVRVDV